MIWMVLLCAAVFATLAWARNTAAGPAAGRRRGEGTDSAADAGAGVSSSITQGDDAAAGTGHCMADTAASIDDCGSAGDSAGGSD